MCKLNKFKLNFEWNLRIAKEEQSWYLLSDI